MKTFGRYKLNDFETNMAGDVILSGQAQRNLLRLAGAALHYGHVLRYSM